MLILVATSSALGYCGYMENEAARQAIQDLKDRVDLMAERAESCDAGPLHDELLEVNAGLRRALELEIRRGDELQAALDEVLSELREVA